jgi:O-Antigen ligase
MSIGMLASGAVATAELSRSAPRGSGASTGPGDRVDRPSRAASALCWALIAALLYAAFAHGVAQYPDETRLQVALCALAALALAALLLGPLRMRAPALAWGGVAALVAFAAWSGITLAWSVAPDNTWIEVNRALAYALVLVLAIALGASHPRAMERLAVGYVIVAALVALYALGGKVAPGIHIGGLMNLDQTAAFSRLRAPLQYWNALALVCVLAIPPALWLAVDSARERATRLAALAALWLFVVVIALTYSRGGFVALGVALVVLIAVGTWRLRALLWLALAAAAAAAPLAIAFSHKHLTDNGVPLHDRISDGALMGGIAAAALVVLLAAGWGAIELEARIGASERRSRWIGWTLAACLALTAIGGLGVLAASSRGFTGEISHGWHSFTRVRQDPITDPGRLLSTNGNNRWVWWKEAGGAWSAKPIGGWGAGSFPVTHLLYRHNQLPVQQPHSMPMQFLAEDGIVGALLACGGVALLLLAALGLVRSLPGGTRDRAVAAALLAAVTAGAAHACIDWDWDIPGATLPSFAMLGVLVGAAGRRMRAPIAAAPPALLGRTLALGTGVLLLCVVAVSALLPGLADSKANDALVSTGNGSPRALRHALAQAELAARLDPLSDAPLLSASAIAERAGLLDRSRKELLDAIGREPSDTEAWAQLARLDLARGDIAGLQKAAARALALDPQGTEARQLAERAAQAQAPPNRSATATGTPLLAPAP